MPSDTIQRVEEKEHRLKFMSFVCRSVDDGIVHAIGRSLACWLAHKFTCFLLRYAMCMNSFLSLSLCVIHFHPLSVPRQNNSFLVRFVVVVLFFLYSAHFYFRLTCISCCHHLPSISLFSGRRSILNVCVQ